MKKIGLLLMLLLAILSTAYAQDEKKYGNIYSQTVKIKDILNLKFNHNLSYYLKSAHLRSPVLYEEKTTAGFWTVAGKVLPSVSYNRSYESGSFTTTSQGVNVGFDLYKIAQEVHDRQKQVEKNKYTRTKLLNDITDQYAKIINYEKIYYKLKELYKTKQKILSTFEKLHRKGGIAEYKLTELKLEIIEMDLKINETKNQLTELLILLHFNAGIPVEE